MSHAFLAFIFRENIIAKRENVVFETLEGRNMFLVYIHRYEGFLFRSSSDWFVLNF